ncbi:MAG: nucleotidyltransferase domain-containing protein [Anaerolineae bacterium]|nr:nucleotidyltransferase domain-containing protein [Anaerolineae bacterium]
MSHNFITHWKERQAERQRQSQVLAQQARHSLPQIVQVLRETYAVERIILFGSLVKGQFTLTSDIDLAVAGLAPAKFFEAYAHVNRLTQFRIDLKPLESLTPHFYRRVLEQGEILYEKPDGS